MVDLDEEVHEDSAALLGLHHRQEPVLQGSPSRWYQFINEHQLTVILSFKSVCKTDSDRGNPQPVVGTDRGFPFHPALFTPDRATRLEALERTVVVCVAVCGGGRSHPAQPASRCRLDS